jgi:hypothetical protein
MYGVGMSFMTDQESQEIQDAVLLKYVRLKMRFDLAQERLNQTATHLEELARVLRSTNRTGFLFTSRPWLNDAALSQMIDDVNSAGKDFGEIRDTAIKLAVPIP